MRRKSSIRMESTFDAGRRVERLRTFAHWPNSIGKTHDHRSRGDTTWRAQTNTTHETSTNTRGCAGSARRTAGRRSARPRDEVGSRTCVRLRVTMLKRVRNVEYEAQRQLNVYSPLAQDQMVLWDEMRTSLSLLWRTPAGSMAWQAHSRSAWCSHPGRLLGRGRS